MSMTKRYLDEVEAERRARMTPEELREEEERLDDERAAYEANYQEDEGGAI